jgi:RNA polymerase sigma-70 factor, ECF subfamily
LFQKASDDELMAKIAAGSDSAFRDLFDRHGSRVLGYCCRFLATQERGEDVTQEVWIKVIRSAPSYRAEGKFASWILSIAHTTCLDFFRNKMESLAESWRSGKRFLRIKNRQFALTIPKGNPCRRKKNRS